MTLARSQSSASHRSGSNGRTSTSHSPPAASRHSVIPASGHSHQARSRRQSHSTDGRHPHGHKHEQYLAQSTEGSQHSHQRHRSSSPQHQHQHPHPHSRPASHARSHSHSPPSVSVTHTTVSGSRAARTPLLPRATFAPDFTSSTQQPCACKTHDVVGAEAAAHGCWGHEPPITPTIPDCQLIPDACQPQQHHIQPQQMSVMPVPVEMFMPVSMPLYPERPHPHSIAGPLTHTPAPLFGWPSVTPRVHGYGQPKYARFVKPDYRRFCYSVGKADVPYFPFSQHSGQGMYGGTGMGPTGPISGWGGEINPNLHRGHGAWVA